MIESAAHKGRRAFVNDFTGEKISWMPSAPASREPGHLPPPLRLLAAHTLQLFPLSPLQLLHPPSLRLLLAPSTLLLLSVTGDIGTTILFGDGLSAPVAVPAAQFEPAAPLAVPPVSFSIYTFAMSGAGE